MLITLGFSMIAVFMYLILTKRLTPMVALILVPLTFAALAGAFGITGQADEGVVDSIMTAIGDFAPTAVLLFFAIIYFGLMIDVGLFDPLIRFILRVVGHDPVRLVVCGATIAVFVLGAESRPKLSTTCRRSPRARSDRMPSRAAAIIFLGVRCE